MQPGEAYRLKSQTLGIMAESNTTFMLPQGAVVVFERGDPDPRMVHVSFESRVYRVFRQDLDDRGDRVQSAP